MSFIERYVLVKWHWFPLFRATGINRVPWSITLILSYVWKSKVFHWIKPLKNVQHFLFLKKLINLPYLMWEAWCFAHERTSKITEWHSNQTYSLYIQNDTCTSWSLYITNGLSKVLKSYSVNILKNTSYNKWINSHLFTKIPQITTILMNGNIW